MNANIISYEERMDQFMLATGNGEDNAKKVAVFLTVIGAETYSLLRDLVHPEKPSSLTYGELTTKLREHFQPRRIVIAERFKFLARKQQQGEPAARFLPELRRLSEHCEFGGFKDEALRDRFVCGLRSESMQRKSLAEDNLLLNTAFKKVQAMEVAELQASKLQHAAGVQEDCQKPTTAVQQLKSRRPELEEVQKATNSSFNS